MMIKTVLSLKYCSPLQPVAEREASCHVGYRSCFYREIPLSENSTSDLKIEIPRRF